MTNKMTHDITKTWQLYSEHEPPKHIDIPLPYLPQGGFIAPLGVQRYIRADLTQGDANEPLEDGQYRWISVMFSDERWQIARVSNRCGPVPNEFYFQVGALVYERHLVSVIGPVIRPPEESK